MKKFRTKKECSKIRVIILIIFFLALFILLSLIKLSKNYPKLTSILLEDFNNDSSLIDLRFLTADLDRLFNVHTFYKDKLSFKNNQPFIYLYNTHDQEKYIDNTSIFDATKLLQNNLSRLGIASIQEEGKPSELLHTGLSAYDISKTFMENISRQKEITYYLDIHRDSASDTTIKIGGKNYAKILFVLGLENKDYLKNKSLMLKMNDYLNTNYPGISKGIYEKKGTGVDGIYNQDFNENVVLIEIGGINNNITEVNNSTEIIALMLYHILGD